MKKAAVLIFCLVFAQLCFAEPDPKKWNIEPGTEVFPSARTGFAVQYFDRRANIVKTTDGGKTWEVCRRGKLVMGHDDADPEGGSEGSENISHLYFMDEKNGFAYGGGQISISVFLTTRDGGKTWEEADNNKLEYLVCDGLQRMQMFNAKEGFILNLSGGLIKTSSGWDEWQTIYPTKQDGYRKYGGPIRDLFYFNDFNTGFLVTEKGVIYTADGGAGWKLTLSMDGWGMDKLVKEGRVIRLVSKSKSYYTSDFGASWKE